MEACGVHREKRRDARIIPPGMNEPCARNHGRPKKERETERPEERVLPGHCFLWGRDLAPSTPNEAETSHGGAVVTTRITGDLSLACSILMMSEVAIIKRSGNQSRKGTGSFDGGIRLTTRSTR